MLLSTKQFELFMLCNLLYVTTVSLLMSLKILWCKDSFSEDSLTDTYIYIKCRLTHQTALRIILRTELVHNPRPEWITLTVLLHIYISIYF